MTSRINQQISICSDALVVMDMTRFMLSFQFHGLKFTG